MQLVKRFQIIYTVDSTVGYVFSQKMDKNYDLMSYTYRSVPDTNKFVLPKNATIGKCQILESGKF